MDEEIELFGKIHILEYIFDFYWIWHQTSHLHPCHDPALNSAIAVVLGRQTHIYRETLRAVEKYNRWILESGTSIYYHQNLELRNLLIDIIEEKHLPKLWVVPVITLSYDHRMDLMKAVMGETRVERLFGKKYMRL